MYLVRKIAMLAACAGLVGLSMPVLAQHGPDKPANDDGANLPGVELTPTILYKLLLGEVAGARGKLDVSVKAYLDLARQTRDPRLARRAAEIALFARDFPAATEAAQLWNDIEPGSEDAQRVLAGVLMRTGARLDKLQAHLARALATAGERLPRHLLGLNGAMVRVDDKAAAREVIDRVTEPYLDRAEARFARAHAAFSAEDLAAAATELDEALVLRPDWEPAVLMKAQLLQQAQPEEALSLLKAFTEKHPDSKQGLVVYARSLAAAKRYAEARDAFDKLLEASPDDRELLNSSALLSMQIKDWPAAERRLHTLLRASPDDEDRVHVMLGQVAASRGNDKLAEQYYRAVGDGEHKLQAQLLIAQLLAKRGEHEAARAVLQAIEGDAADVRRARVAEAQVLRDAGRYGEAYQLLDKELGEDHDDPDLLYETALLAERLGKTEVMEGRLRMLLSVNPENAHALNALGYSFADRGVRLDEAYALISRALELQPDDPFILDSLGWVHFRRGEHDKALEVLQRAYSQRDDPEIAAHVGEVLWSLQRQDEARRVWSEAKERNPDSKELQKVIDRYLR